MLKITYENEKGNKQMIEGLPDFGEATLKIADGEIVHVKVTQSIDVSKKDKKTSLK